MAALELTAAQAETVADYLADPDLNTVRLSMSEPYGNLRIQRWAPDFTDDTLVNHRGEWLGDVTPPRGKRVADDGR